MTFNGKELSDMTAKEISHVLVADTDKLTPEQRSWFKYLWDARKEWEWMQTDEYKLLVGLEIFGLGLFLGIFLFA